MENPPFFGIGWTTAHARHYQVKPCAGAKKAECGLSEEEDQSRRGYHLKGSVAGKIENSPIRSEMNGFHLAPALTRRSEGATFV